MTADARLAEQIDYYSARAGEYDDWWYRRGRYDRGPAANAKWFHEAALLQSFVASLGALGEAAELAAGTGLWTRWLAAVSSSVLAVDASAEVLTVNRARVRSEKVSFEVADLFAWEPRRDFDTVFFSFWLSHVPPERFEQFWDLVARALRPGGRAVFIDSLYTQTSTATDHQLEGPDSAGVTRRLDDGREFRIVKVFYEPASLAERLRDLGWDSDVKATGEFFLQGVARRRG